MSNFTPLVEKEYKFEGDAIRVKLSRLKRKHLLTLFGDFSALADIEDEKKRKAKISSAMMDLDEDIINECVVEFAGLKDSDGNPVLKEVVFSELYFLELATEIFLDLMSESFVAGKAK